jgi:hypothetical protein
LIFGLIGLFFRSGFPIGLGLFLAVVDDRFIEWVLRKVGIQLVPDTLGPEFIKAFVFLLGLWILFSYWRDSTPGWLLQWVAPSQESWYLIAGAALICALLQRISAAVVEKLLPRFGIAIAPGRQSLAILGVLGVLIGLAIATASIFAP